MQRYVEYAFYNPKTGRLLTASFGEKFYEIHSAEYPEGYNSSALDGIDLKKLPEGYILLGEV